MENLTDNTTSDEFNLSLIPSIDTYYKRKYKFSMM